MAKKKNLKQSHKQKRETAQIPVCAMTVQDTVPILAMYESDNIIQPYPGCFMKSYTFTEINYQTSTEEEQTIISEKLEKVFNCLPDYSDFDLSIALKQIDLKSVYEKTLKREVGDELDGIRQELNKVIKSWISDGKNGLQVTKCYNLSVHTPTIAEARELFIRLESTLKNLFSDMDSNFVPMDSITKIGSLYDIFNPDRTGGLIEESTIVEDNGRIKKVKMFDFENIRKMGISINDAISPSHIAFHDKYIEIGDKVCRVLKIYDFAPATDDNFLNVLINMDFNMLVNFHTLKLPNEEADKFVSQTLKFIRNQKGNQIKALAKDNMPPDMVSEDIKRKEAEVVDIIDDLHSAKDTHLFETTLTVMVYAENLAKLRDYTTSVITTCRGLGAKIDMMTRLQEEGFYSTLPLCFNVIKETRTLETDALTAFMPFSVIELNDENGVVYSKNAINRKIVQYNRLMQDNFNGFILGSPGSGKSFTAKIEMVNVFCGSNGDIICIDPEAEYGRLARLLKGQEIILKPGGKHFLNPMEIIVDNHMELEEDANPVLQKADFIQRVIECMLHKPFGIDSVQSTLIMEAVHRIYEPFMVNGVLQKIPPEKMPTLDDLLKILVGQAKEYDEAREIAITLRKYCSTGPLNTFGKRSNVNINSRFVSFNILEIGDDMKQIAMLIIQDYIWNKIIQNRRLGKNTWFYCDEIHLLFKDNVTANFLEGLWRRMRKYGGVPTGITQFVSDMLDNDVANKMLAACKYVQIMNQEANDRLLLQKILNLSDTQLAYITTAPKGSGLIYTGKATIPISSKFPNDNAIYRAMTSDMREIKAYENEERYKKQKESSNNRFKTA